MNKTELTTAMAEQAGISKKDAEKALKAFTDVVTDELKKGEGSACGLWYVRGFREGSQGGEESSDKRAPAASGIQGSEV